MENSDAQKFEVHPDFASPADATLVSDDGTIFHVASSQLAGASGWFRKLSSVAQAKTKQEKYRVVRHIVLPQDTLTLGILLQICCGRLPRFSRLEDLCDLELCLFSADQYEMPGAKEVLLLLLHDPRMQADALHLHQVAEHYEQLNIEHIASTLDAPALGRLCARRQERIEKFCALLVQKDAAAAFHLENSGHCTHPIDPRIRHKRANPELWTALVLALQTAFIKWPSVAALESDEQVKLELANGPPCHVRGFASCKLLQYEWRDIRSV